MFIFIYILNNYTIINVSILCTSKDTITYVSYNYGTEDAVWDIWGGWTFVSDTMQVDPDRKVTRRNKMRKTDIGVTNTDSFH